MLQKLTGKLKTALYDEINILKGLQHPHIVALYDCLEGTNHIHLVMEFCPWGDLSVFLRKREAAARQSDLVDIFKRYPNPKAAGLNEVIVRHFLQQLASALQFLREKSLVHRDIKPQNLLINPTAQYLAKRDPENSKYGLSDRTAITPIAGLLNLPMLKLADFGFARVLPKTALAETLCGSPLYMAPEILRYEKYDATADLWSVGTVLYELLTGRPPFRAANHIDLLRKVEQSRDVIRFPEEPTVSSDMKEFIRALLKRNSVERMGFNDFFDHRLIKGDIPGVAEEDRPRPKSPRRASLKPPATDHQQTARKNQKKAPSSRSMEESGASDNFVDAVDYVAKAPTQRPNITHNVTAPVGHTQAQRRQAPPLMSNRSSPRDVPSAIPSQARRAESLSGPSKMPKEERLTVKAAQEAREVRETREQAANDVAFERDYVVVEKRAVEVNAFADELAASPRLNGPKKNETQMALQRRNTTQNTPSTGPQVTQATANKALQAVSGKRPDHLRQASYEKRTRIGTSAISKAINMASGRLLSLGLSPPLGVGRSGPSPPLYTAYPAHPTPVGAPLLLEDGSKSSVPVDEDAMVLQVIEEYAHRSDVVYGFADIKYKQLIPLAPSEDHGLGLQEAGIPDKEESSRDDGGLTVDAMLTLSEEALVLFVKSMTLLSVANDIAIAWWAKKTRNEATEEGASGRRSQTQLLTTVAFARINKVVQWARDRYNENWEKTDFVRQKLLATQKRLPSHHPMHPDNQSISSSSTVSGSLEVGISPGVSAEKIMFTRAMEMGRGAAVNELVGDDLPGCEVSYVTAIRLLEAVLEREDESGTRKLPAPGKEQGDPRGKSDDLVIPEDREDIIKSKQSVHQV